MRKVKYRAYDKWLKITRDVKSIDFENEKVMFYADDFTGDEHAPSLDIERSFDEVELMQYTGVKDRNGKEICEGDIIEYKNELKGNKLKGRICFERCKFLFVAYSGEKHNYQINYIELDDYTNQNYVASYLKVIGNIYENRELLREESLDE